MRWPCALALGLGLLAGAICWGAGGAGYLMNAMEQYNQANFPAARDSLHKALAAGDLTPEMQARAHFYLGLVYQAVQNRDKVLEHFGLAKKAYGQYRPPGGQSQQVMALWRQAKPGGAAAAPAAPAPAASLGIIWETQGKLMLDRGTTHGVKQGDRFAVVVATKYQHPVSGYITRSEKIAVVQVSQVYADSADVTLVSGNVKNLRAKLQAQAKKCLPIEKLKPTAAAATAPAPASQPGQEPGQGKIAVLPPFIKDPEQNHGPAGWPGGYDAQKAAAAIARVEDMPGVPQAVSEQQLNAALSGVQGFNASDYLKETGSLESLAGAVVHASVDDLLRPPLTKKQTTVLAQIMTKLGVQYAVIWGFYYPAPDQQGKLLVCMYEKNSRKPLLVGSSQVGYEDVLATYPKAIETIAWLNYKQRDQQEERRPGVRR
ncbi:MAG: FlgT C-terminal domain-containing protein [Thermodesulfobacteriota bacterium]